MVKAADLRKMLRIHATEHARICGIEEPVRVPVKILLALLDSLDAAERVCRAFSVTRETGGGLSISIPDSDAFSAALDAWTKRAGNERVE